MTRLQPHFCKIEKCHAFRKHTVSLSLAELFPICTSVFLSTLLLTSAMGTASAATDEDNLTLVYDQKRTAQYGNIVSQSSIIDGQGRDLDLSQTALSELTIQNTNGGSADFVNAITNFGTIAYTDGKIIGTGGITGQGKSYYFLSSNNGSLVLDKVVFKDIQTKLRPFLFNCGDVYLNETVLNGYTSHATSLYTGGGAEDGFIYLWTGSAYVSNSSFENISDTIFGAAIEGSGGETLQITNSRFANNKSRYYGGSIFWYWDSSYAVAQSINIQNSEFVNNHGRRGGGAIYMYTAGDKYLISDSTFSGNTTYGTGGAITLFSRKDTTFNIRNSTFSGNETWYLSDFGGGAVYFRNVSGTDNDVLNIIADEGKDTVFTDNWTFIYISDSEKGYVDNDLAVNGVTVNLNADDGSRIVFDDSVASLAQDDDGNYTYDTLNINKPGVTYQYEFKADVDSEKQGYTATAPATGEVVFNSDVVHMDIHTYGGTLSLLPDTSAAEDGSAYENTRLASSYLTVEAPTVLKIQNETPIHEAAYSTKDELALLELTQGAVIQRITLGDKLTLNANLYVQPAVNLETAVSDKFAVGEGGVSGTGKIMVNGWIITADKHSNTVVKVRLSDEESPLGEYFGLDKGSGALAYGPIYVWDVAYEGDSVYEFVRREPEPYFFDDRRSGDEDTTEPDGTGDSEIAVLSDDDNLLAEIADVAPSDFTPKDFTPDVYGEQVAALGISVIQHAISESVFSESGIGSIDYLLKDEMPEHQRWWGKVTAASLELKTKNFHTIDMDFGIGMIGHQFDPLRTAAGDFLFGAYVGAVHASTRYSISRIRQNGAFIGGSVLYKNGHAWAGAHANVGVMSNHLKGLTDNKGSTPWLGVGTSVGYTFEIASAKMAITPMFDFSYVTIKAVDYRTDQGAEVKNSALHSFELAPGLRVDKQFAEGWSAYAQGRYAFVSKHDGSARVGYPNEATHHLPGITNKNYAEYGLGVQKQVKNFGFGLNLNRNDGGRQGWTGMARVSYRF